MGRIQLHTFTLLLLLLSATCFSPNQGSAAETEMLDLDLASLMQIKITSAGRKTQNLADVPAAIYVIEQKDIHNSGVTSIPEALRMVPGLQVARIGSSKWAITSRGFNGIFANKLLVQIDGRSVYTPSYSGVYWDAQNVLLEDVDRIEVIRGPGATLWGANAVNGVINIITKSSSDTQGVLVSAGAGNHEKGLASFRLGTQFSDDIYGRFYVSHHAQDSYRFAADGTDSQDEWDTTVAGFRLDGDIELNDSWTFQGDAYQGEINQRVDTYWVSSSATPIQVQDSFKPQGLNLIGRWTHNFTGNNSWTLQAYYDYFKRGDIYVQQAYHIFDLDFQHRFQLATRHDIIWGLGFRQIRDKFGNSDNQLVISPDQQIDNLKSAFVQDEINLVQGRLWLTLGSKIERNDFTGTEIQPSARVLWKPANGHSLWSAVSRAVRTPSRVEDSGHLILNKTVVPLPPPSTPLIVPITLNSNPDMAAEELMAYEAGYRYLPNADLAFDLACFYNVYDKLRSVQSVTASDLLFANDMEGETYGVEFSVDWNPNSWLTTEVSYSYIDLQMKDTDAANLELKNVNEGSSPQNQLSLRSGIELGQNIQLNLWGRFIDKLTVASPQALTQNLEVENYFTLDSNISWKPQEGLELMLVGQNLLNNRHLEFVQEAFTSPIEIERSIYAKLTWEF